MTDWQPIATAPKDGARVLLLKLGDPPEYVVAWFGGFFGSGWNDHGDIGAAGYDPFEPDFWMPLPPPPPEPPHD